MQFKEQFLDKYHSLSESEKEAFLIFLEKEDPSFFREFIEKETQKFTSIEKIEKNDTGTYLVSSAQKRMFLINQLEVEDISYNLPRTIEIIGEYDHQSLTRSFEGLIARHESFRTSFHMENGQPVQKIHDPIQFKIEYDVCEESDVKNTIAEFIRPFQLNLAPLLRVKVLKIEKGRHLLLLDIHHIISDGITMNILLKELSGMYAGVKLPDYKIQYKDFAAWQNKFFETSLFSDQKEYWLKTFSGELPVLKMPTDFNRPAIRSTNGAVHCFKVEKGLAARIKKIARENGATLFMVLLGAFKVLLSKYSGQNDLIVGTPVAGRNHVDLHNIVGVFVNFLALRSYPSAKKKFRDYLREIKQSVLEAFDNQDYPFEELVDNLDIARDISRNPLFDTMLILHNMDSSEITLKGLELKPYDYDLGVSRMDLVLDVFEQDNGIDFQLEYTTKLYKSETIERFVAHFVRLLDIITTDVQVQIGEIELLDKNEKKNILESFNQTSATYDKYQQIHVLFEDHVNKNPNEIALVFESQSLTYQELNIRSNQLARKLRQQGVVSNQLVAIIAKPSLELIIGLMGILKAGGAYVPIDPEFPKDRIKYMIADSKARILLIQNQLEHGFDFSGTVIDLDDTGNYVGDTSNLEVLGTSKNLAYVIYTSGSTGRPKGVMIEHQQLQNFVFAMRSGIPFQKEDCFLGITTFSFDLFGSEFYLSIFCGNKLVLSSNEAKKDPKAIKKIIENNGVSVLHKTPSTIGGLVNEDGLKDLDLILVGGEELPERILKQIKKKSDARIFNMFGPTETTIWSSMEEVTNSNTITIGKPLKNTSFYILDGNQKVCPIGVDGEIYIAGDGVARGYHNRVDLTSKKFISNPYLPNQKMYKTGDLGRWLSDGKIEFLGRIDHQVKIRGFRIELGEIENAFSKIEGVKETVIIPFEKNGDKYLAGYYVGESSKTVKELKAELSKTLPSYMIPSYFIHMEKIPLNTSGKIDRKSLPAPEGRINTGVEYVEPRNEIEEVMVKNWKDVLGVKEIGIYDNFFELGGNSLSAIKVVNLGNNNGMRISVLDIFKHGTISELSAYAKYTSKRRVCNISTVKSIDIQPAKYKPYYPCHLGTVYEMIKYQSNYTVDIPESMLPIIYGVPLVGNVSLSVNRYIENVVEVGYSHFIDIEDELRLESEILDFSSKAEAINYCRSEIDNDRVVIVTGETYFLNYTMDYNVGEDKWFKKTMMLPYFSDDEKRIPHNFLLTGYNEQEYTVLDITFGYHGRIPKEDFERSFEGVSGMSVFKGWDIQSRTPPFQVVKYSYDEHHFKKMDYKKISKRVLFKTLSGFFSEEEFKHKIEYAEIETQASITIGFLGMQKFLNSLDSLILFSQQQIEGVKTYLFKNLDQYHAKLKLLLEYLHVIDSDSILAKSDQNQLACICDDYKSLIDELGKIGFLNLFYYCRSLKTTLGSIIEVQKEVFTRILDSVLDPVQG